MKFRKFLQPLVCALALTVSAGVVTSSVALAAKAKAEAEYPNTKRSEPKNDLREADQKKLSKAQDLIGEDNAKAQELLQDVIDKSKSNYAKAFAHQLLSSVYSELEQDDKAISEQQAALDSNGLPNDAHFGAMYRLAQMQVQAEKYQDALTTLDTWATEGGKTTADSDALRGNIYYRLDKYQDAINAINKANAASEKANDGWNQILMASYFELNQFPQAAEVAKAQLAKNPKDMKLVKQLATVYVQGDNYPAAMELLSKAKNDGLITTSDDYVQLAKLYANAEKPKDAAAVLKEGLDKGIVSGDYENYRLLGDTSAQAEDDAGALAAYAKASPLAKDGYVDYQRGYLLYYTEHPQEAKAAMDLAIQKGNIKQEGEAYLIRGDVNSELNQDAAAMADWQKAAGYPSTKTMAEQRIKASKGGVKMKKSPKPGSKTGK